MVDSLSTSTLRIIDRQVRIEWLPFLELTAGSHRLFFTSIAGFSVAEEFHGYQAPVAANTGRILEVVVRYLQGKRIPIELDSTALALIQARKASAQELEAARIAGLAIHQGQLFGDASVPGFLRELKPYQLPAVAHMVAVNHSANFSVPGSGKTTMVLAAFARLKASSSVDKLLVVGPRSCFAPWEEEFEGCFGRAPQSVRLTGSPGERADRYDEISDASTDLGLVTYQTASNDAAALIEFLQRHRVMLVLDESHYIKRLSGGLWARTLLELAPFATRRVVLTGTQFLTVSKTFGPK